MQFDLARAHQRFLRLTGPQRPQTDEEVRAVDEVVFMPGAKRFLRQVLEPGGVSQGGPLFGSRHGGVIRVDYAAMNGYSSWYPTGEPLSPNEHYLLGLTDAFRQATGTPIDWVGHWASHADSAVPSVKEAIKLYNQALSTRLVDEDHFLAFVGWCEGELSGYICISATQHGQIGNLSSNLGTAGLTIVTQ